MPIDTPTPEQDAAPAPPRRERGGIVPALTGAALSLIFIPFLILHRDGGLDLLALILAASGGIYWGVAVTEKGRRGVVALEVAAGVAFVAMAMLGLWWSSIWIVIGYVLHGIYDFLHHPRGIRTAVRRSFPPFCAVFDWLVAVYILIWR